MKEEDIIKLDEDLGVELTQADVAFMVAVTFLIGLFIVVVFAGIVKMIMVLIN